MRGRQQISVAGPNVNGHFGARPRGLDSRADSGGAPGR